MHNKVVHRVSKALYLAGFDVIRFNFRGVGKSQGTFGGGLLEGYDLLGAYAFLLERNYLNIAIVAYSFGSAVGLSQINNLELKCFAAVGFPTTYNQVADFAIPSESVNIPTLFVSGENDSFSQPKLIKDYIKFDINPEVRIIKKENHFFETKWQELCDIITEFTSKHF